MILLLFESRLFNLQTHHLAGNLIQLSGHGVHLSPDRGAGLIQQVDRLIRQKTILDIAIRENRGRDKGGIQDAHIVMALKAFLQSAQNRDCILNPRSFDLDRLEATLKGGVFLHILTILIQCGRANTVQLTTGQHGFEHVAGIRGALGLTRAYDRVNLINKKQDTSFSGLDLIQNRLEPLFKITAELGTRHQRCHV